MFSSGTITLFRVGGVPVRIHFTWLFIAAWLFVMFTGQFFRLANAAEVADADLLLPPWAWGVIMTVSLFGCVLLHELAHVTIGRRVGARARGITLMMLGGVSEMSEVEDPRSERWMALAGPILSFALAGFFYLVFRLAGGGPADVRFGLYYLAQINVALGAFNLLPAFPLDGGRVLRSVLAQRFGRLRATQIAATVGKVLAASLALWAIFGGGFWLLIVALFIFVGGDAESRALSMREVMRGLRVADLYTPRVAFVDAGATVADAATAMLEARTDACVVRSGDRPVGVVTAAALAAIPVRERAGLHVAGVARRPVNVALDEDISAALAAFDHERADAVCVVEAGEIAGTLSRDDLARAVQLRELTTASG